MYTKYDDGRLCASSLINSYCSYTALIFNECFLCPGGFSDFVPNKSSVPAIIVKGKQGYLPNGNYICHNFKDLMDMHNLSCFVFSDKSFSW
jgi:hypothetical protein